MNVTSNKLQEYCNRAAAITGMAPQDLMWFIDIEAVKVSTREGLAYDSDSRSKTGKFRGLGQMSLEAWNAASVWLKKRGHVLAKYEEAWNDPFQNILATAAYSTLLVETVRDAFKRKGVVVVDFAREIRYAIYNQGPGFIIRAMKGKSTVRDGQSPEATQVLATATAQVRELIS